MIYNAPKRQRELLSEVQEQSRLIARVHDQLNSAKSKVAEMNEQVDQLLQDTISTLLQKHAHHKDSVCSVLLETGSKHESSVMYGMQCQKLCVRPIV